MASTRAIIPFLLLGVSPCLSALELREHDSKVLIGTRFLLAQPNASSPAPLLLKDLDAEILEEYQAFTLARVNKAALDTLRQRARGPGVELRVSDHYDKLFVNGYPIDTRLGMERFLPDRGLDPPYHAYEVGTWLVQFIGPIKDAWLEGLAADGGAGLQDFALGVFNGYPAGGPAPLGKPSNLVAEAETSGRVLLSWAGAPGAATYDVQRTPSVNQAYQTIGSTAAGTTSYTDSTVQSNATYLYRVRARNDSPVASFSNVDVATTVIFSDDPLLTGVTMVKAQHIVELRTAANAMVAAAGLSPRSWEDPTLTPGASVPRVVHLNELRAAVDQSRNALGLPSQPYTDQSLVQGVSTIRAVHLEELRERLR